MKNFSKINRALAAKKKFLSLFFALLTVSVMNAKVAFLVPATDTNETSMQYEKYGDDEQSPERRAWRWFRDNFVTPEKGQFICFNDLASIPSDIHAIWIYVDRVNFAKTGTGSFDALFADHITELQTFVNNGGNVFLCKQATRLEKDLVGAKKSDNTVLEPSYECGDYKTDYNREDKWGMSCNFYDGDGWGSYLSHAMFAPIPDNHKTNDRHIEMVWSDPLEHVVTNNNCLFTLEHMEMSNTYDRDHLSAFQNRNNCKVLGCWSNGNDCHCGGLIEFYPNGNRKGTVIMMGLAAYQWINNNGGWGIENIQYMTKGALEYLDAVPNLAWNPATIQTSGVIGEDHYMTASATTGYTIRYAADHPEIANIGNTDGRVFYNYFGSTTFHATATGDGWNVPKATATIASGTITVNGGTEANPRYAYVLPYSLHVMANYDNEEDRRPDYEAAQWFHDQFIDGEVGGKHGVYVRPADLASLNSAIKVLWIHNDHIGQTAQSYYDDLGGDTFRGNLAAFLENGGNVLVTKQATRLIGDLGRNVYPEYHNGDDGRGYADRGPWRIANKWNLGGTEIDHSTHSVYANMGTDTWLMAAGRHTDNNDIWTNFGAYGDEDPQRITKYEEDHNCKVLGAYGHYNENNVVSPKIECVGMVEYYPQDNLTLNASSTTYDQNGTIIALGLAAYHWIKDINETEKTPPLMKNFTRDILYYLNINEVPSFAWIAQPADGLAGSEQRIQIEDKATALRWTVSDLDIAELVADPEHPDDQNYKILRLKAPGEVTVTATRSADGYKIPKTVTGTPQVTKTIAVTNAYTRDVTEGAYGTICLPKTAASYTGATMFRIADKTENGIVIEEVNAMEAGKPYIFQATASTINVTYGEGAPVAASSDNGLIGYIGENNLELTANENHYILANDQIWKVNITVQVPSNRAYVDMNAINATPQAAPRRHISVKNTPTGVDELQETNGAVKQIKDGQLIIIRNEHMFNAQGQMIQ